MPECICYMHLGCTSLLDLIKMKCLDHLTGHENTLKGTLKQVLKRTLVKKQFETIDKT